MKKIRFTEHILPHLIAIGIFLIVTVFFFSPIFFDNKGLEQHDIQQFGGSAKSIIDNREKTGEEALWADAMFSGMPAYLISVKWGNSVISYTKGFLSVGLPHPVSNIYLAFVCFYIMLLAFGVRPYIAIAGALAFGLSSYMIIGLGAGHNARIGAIAFMPLVVGGIHLAFNGKRLLGFGITTMALALHLRENHLQITYYLLLIVLVYGLVRLIEAIREKTLADFFKTVGLLIPAAVIGAGTYFGQLWAVTEYTAYSIRGKSELSKEGKSADANVSGLTKTYAFEYSNGILEPFTMLIPNFYGGSTSNFLVQDQKSETYKALVNSGNDQMANQLVNYTSAYWGPQFNSAPYYGGAIIVFLFATGIAFANRKYIWWLVPLIVLGIILSWGSNFESFNYFMFDYFPGYNKFRSVTFTIIIALFGMTLLGMLGLEKIVSEGFDKKGKTKLIIAFAATGGLCLLLWMFAGMFSFMRDMEAQLPEWFTRALIADRKSLFRGDAFRSFAFITAIFIMLYFQLFRKITPVWFYVFVIFMITVDVAIVDKRYLSNDRYKRKREANAFPITEADQEILKDKSYYRVYNLNPRNPYEAFQEARTSYYHYSIGGYHGAKLRRYQDFYDSCIVKQTMQLFTDAQQGKQDFSNYSAFNMLNVKYIYYGPERNNIIVNTGANGNAWFITEVIEVKSPIEELDKSCGINSRATAVIDVSKFKTPKTVSDSSATISLTSHTLNILKYESNSAEEGLAVFSEIYYPKGWKAFVDGKETEILRANYILRGLIVPAGKHTIEFKFEPDAYYVGNKITTISSWLALIILLASLGITFRKKELDH